MIRSLRRLAPSLALTGALAALAGVLAGVPARAQAPDADWRTIETGRFTVHYPASSEAWARHAAARLDSIWARVEGEVGYRPPDRLTVVISDPVAEPNGAALPFLGWPRMVLWTSPPGPESVIGHYTDWADLVLVHESAHLVHLLRRSRNPRSRLLAPFLPVGPLTLRAPRWVTEGYATVVEGRLTGSGRPHGDLRAAILRRRAQQGRLPGYGALNSDESWYGGSMAYLMGSAFLEWLDERAGPGSLPKLWARMSARKSRSFESAFEGVYGDSPSELYGRFTAELTHQALAAEEALAPALREGELWQDLAWTTGAPALSPEGDRLALVLRDRDDPDELVVWSTAPDEEAEREWRKERDEIAERDPEDVPAVRTKPLAREPLFRLPTIDGIAPTTPRFLPGGKSILFVRYEPDADGFLHPDLFRWDLPEGGQSESAGTRAQPAEPGEEPSGTGESEETGPEATGRKKDRARTGGRVVRLTREADLRDPDPGPDGTWAVAVRNRDGLSQVVRVDLATGAIEPLTEASIGTIYDQPRVSRDGGRVAFALHREGLWRLAVHDLATGVQTEIPPPEPGATVSAPAWSRDGSTLYASVGNRGYVDVWSFPVASAAPSVASVSAGPPGPGGAADPAAPAASAGLPSASGLPDSADPATAGPGDGAALGPVRLTRVRGAALAPAPTPESAALFFLSLEPDGLDLRLIEIAGEPPAAEPAPPDLPSSLAPAVAPPRPPAPAPFAEAEVPPGRPYGLGRQELLVLTSGRATSAGSTTELGLRAGDVVGRLDLLALGSPGGDGAPRGGALAGTFRGWPVGLSLHLFSAEEEPSRQRGDLPLGGLPLRGLDVDRDGAELRAAWERRLGPDELNLSGGALWTSTAPRQGEDRDETVAFAEAGYRASRGRGKWRLEPAAWVHWESGAGEGGRGSDRDESWNRRGGRLGLGIGRDDAGLTLAWRRDDSSGTFTPYQLFQVGGVSSSLLPRSALANRIRVPALPAGTLTGFEYEGQRADLQLEFLPAPLFYERHRLGDGAGNFGDWLTLAGLEWTFTLDPQPLGRIPALDLQLGAARILDSPLPGRLYEDDTRWWLTLVVRP